MLFQISWISRSPVARMLCLIIMFVWYVRIPTEDPSEPAPSCLRKQSFISIVATVLHATFWVGLAIGVIFIPSHFKYEPHAQVGKLTDTYIQHKVSGSAFIVHEVFTYQRMINGITCSRNCSLERGSYMTQSKALDAQLHIVLGTTRGIHIAVQKSDHSCIDTKTRRAATTTASYGFAIAAACVIAAVCLVRWLHVHPHMREHQQATAPPEEVSVVTNELDLATISPMHVELVPAAHCTIAVAPIADVV